MTEAELRSRLLTDSVPGELEAGERSWRVLRAAFGTRERKPWFERHSRAALAMAAAAALAVAAVTPPGRALVERVREAAGVSPSEPALVRLPASGQLLVQSGRGPWVVREDGSKRRLGAYQEASWSPRGLFVVATSGQRLVALEPDGDVRWTVTRPGHLEDARWAPSGFRIAYREGESLRVVVGDGTSDRALARAIAPVAPAWRPDELRNVLAYLDRSGTLRVVDVDSRDELWQASFPGNAAKLAWSADGSRLLALSADGKARLYDSRGREAGGLDDALGAAFSPTGDLLAYTTYDPASDTATVWVAANGRPRMLFMGTGRFQDLAWSPDGRWLLVTWPGPDQWLFFRTPTVRGPVSVSNVTEEFDPGSTGAGTFPHVSGWAPSPSG